MRRAVLVTVFLAGCVAVDAGIEPVRWLDRAAFDARVEPVLDLRCASVACHGKPERELSLYAPLRWRENPSRDEPLDASEHQHNYVASCLAQGALARKALGGDGHPVVFVDRADPDYAVLEAWVH